MRAAIYARMSTDKQSADSPADQIARCREFAERRGFRVMEPLIFEDAGISGASRHNRPRLLELVARIDEWDVLLCWEFARLARDSEDLGWIRNRLRLHKRTAFESSTGLDLFNVGAKVMGVMNEEYLVKLRADVQRGLRGRAERGFSAGGLPYGYRSVPVGSGRFDPHGAEIASGYRLEVDHDQADTVRRIFALYATGIGLRAIAHDLNADGIPSPRGKGWAPSALRALLLNPIYRGEYVWNRSEWVKDHETGKRKRFERPESEWVRQELPELRIVSDRQWSDVQACFDRHSREYARTAEGRIVAKTARTAKTRHLLSGLLECGVCGGTYYALNGRGEFGCSWHRDRGAAVCANGFRIARQELEDRVLGAVRERILIPENVAYAVELALEIVRARLAPSDVDGDRKRLADLEAKIERAVDLAIETGGISVAKRKLATLEQERATIAARPS